VLALTTDANAERSLADYRYFRSLSIDLQGRMPTRAEIAAFEQDSFDLNGWIDQQLHTAAYADRVRRVYLDLLRLEVGGSFQFVQSETVLRRVSVLGPDGKPTNIYFRLGQRRSRPETDISFCLTQAETGVQFPHFAEPTGTEIPVSQAVLDKYTRVIKPWWLYRDYASQAPTDLYDAIKWQQKTPGFALAAGLVSDDGIDPNTQIRVCAEETELGPVASIVRRSPPRTRPSTSARPLTAQRPPVRCFRRSADAGWVSSAACQARAPSSRTRRSCFLHTTSLECRPSTSPSRRSRRGHACSGAARPRPSSKTSSRTTETFARCSRASRRGSTVPSRSSTNR